MAGRMRMLAGLALAAVLTAGCSSATDIMVQAPGVSEEQPHATLRVARHPWLIASPVKIAPARAGAVWQNFAAADSVSMAALKTGYAYTPVGMASNLFSRKSVLGTETVYRVPPGPQSVMVFNYYLRAARGEPGEPPDDDELAESGSWGTILTFTALVGGEYRLSPTMMTASTSQFGMVPACMAVLDRGGRRVKAVTRFCRTPAPRGERSAWPVMRRAVARKLPEHDEALGKFNRAVAADPPPAPNQP